MNLRCKTTKRIVTEGIVSYLCDEHGAVSLDDLEWEDGKQINYDKSGYIIRR